VSRTHDHGSRECREIFERLSEYLDGELDPDLCSSLESHMDGCDPCQAFMESLRRTVRLVRDQDPRKVPPEVIRAVRAALAKTP
jgi:anti-sigma factor (TIGR02949 family)